MKKQLMVMLSLATVACVTGYNPRFYFNEVQVVNLSSAIIEDVRVGFVDSPRRLDCEEVAKHAMCADRFNRRYYPQQGIELSWIHTDGGRKSGLFTPAIPVTFNAAFALRIVMEINADGSVKSFYEQDDPGRDRVRVNKT